MPGKWSKRVRREAAAQVFTSQFTPGTGPLTLVLLPALFVGNWLWDHTWKDMNDAGWPVVRFDEAISLIDRQTAQSINHIATSLLRECRLHTSGPLVAVGDSLGGLIALEFAESFPEDTIGIVVSGAPGLNLKVANFAIELGRDVKDADEFADRFVTKLLYEPSRHAIDEARYRAVIARLSQPDNLASMLSGLRAIRDYEVRRLLPKLRCRKLFLWGRQDEITPVGPWEEIVPRLDHARLVVFDECGHAPMFEVSAAFNAEVLKFLQECAASAPQADAVRFISSRSGDKPVKLPRRGGPVALLGSLATAGRAAAGGVVSAPSAAARSVAEAAVAGPGRGLAAAGCIAARSTHALGGAATSVARGSAAAARGGGAVAVRGGSAAAKCSAAAAQAGAAASARRSVSATWRAAESAGVVAPEPVAALVSAAWTISVISANAMAGVRSLAGGIVSAAGVITDAAGAITDIGLSRVRSPRRSASPIPRTPPPTSPAPTR